MTDLLTRLAAPFPPADVQWRVGTMAKDGNSGKALAYLDARAVADRLDEVCGPYWQCRYPIVGEQKGQRTVCEIGVRLVEEWVWRADGADDTDFEGAKGGLSDAFKRAAVRWGIGRYLYHLDAPWVPIENKRITPEGVRKLTAIASRAFEGAATRPEPETDLRALFVSLRDGLRAASNKAAWAEENKGFIDQLPDEGKMALMKELTEKEAA